MIHPILRRYWPPESQIQLLTVALAEREAAATAWREWLKKGNLDDASWAEIRLLAAVANRLRLLDPASPYTKRLEGVRRFVWTNTQITLNASRPLLTLMVEAGLRLMLIKGAARLALDPRSSADRSVRDIDVLVHPDDWPRALDLANAEGWRSSLWPTLGPHVFPHHHSILVRNADRGAVDIHHAALYMNRNVGDDGGLWSRARPVSLRGIPLCAPSPADEIVLTVAHGLLENPEPVADWVLDIAPVLRSGAVDWSVVEKESRDREIGAFLASGLLLAAERFALPVPDHIIGRAAARLREPFLTDFQSFATCFVPYQPWMIDRARAAAGLRALQSIGRSSAASASADSLQPAAPAQSSPSSCKALSFLARSLRVTLPAVAARSHADMIPVVGGRTVSVPIPGDIPPASLLSLTVAFEIAAPTGSFPALEVTAPGLVLKRSPAGDGRRTIRIDLPAALFSGRRIETIGFRAVDAADLAPITDVSVTWVVNGDPQRNPAFAQLFDAGWYRDRYGGAIVEGVAPLWDYLLAGWMEGRNPGPGFDGNAYLRRYPDVAAAEINPLVHYVLQGKSEGRRISRIGSEAASAGDSDFASVARLVEHSGFFDAAFYRSAYPEIAASGVEPLDDFMDRGWRRGRSPGPRFDTELYLLHHPDVAATGVNSLVHYLRHGQSEGRRPRGPDDRLVAAIRAATPGLIRAEPQLAAPVIFRHPEALPYPLPGDYGPVAAAFGAIFASLDRPYDRIVFMRGLPIGGAELIGLQAAEAAVETHGPHSVLIVGTDSADVEARHWVPPGADVRILSDLNPALSHDDRVRLVAALIQAVDPKAVLNVNSRACWDATLRHGRTLSQQTDLFALLFCRDYTPDNRPTGYADSHFRDCLPMLKRVYFDSEVFRHELASLYGLTAAARAKLATVRSPPDGRVVAWERPAARANRRFSVLWAGRWCRQKGIELLIEIARLMPDCDFHVFGTGDSTYTRMLRGAAGASANLIVEGAYPSFSALPIERHDAFLYTSLWDGTPRVLVSAGASGMPVVASLVGGIGELIDETTGWPVADIRDPLAHVRALEALRADPAEADRRRRRLIGRVAGNHDREVYRSRLAAEGGFLGEM